MLILKDINKNTIQQWNIENKHNEFVFIVQKQNYLFIFEDKSTITIFYGFLDQEYNNNPAEFIAKLLLQKGTSGLNMCYGSFILIQYNHISNKFILTNDALGDFSAHYYKEKNTIYISDLPEPLLNSKNSNINEDRLLHFFANNKPTKSVGFFSKIRQLRPGQHLTIFKDDFIVETYYQPPQEIRNKNSSIEDLSAEFSSLMQQVIKYQARGQNKIGVIMSGGLDSTFVATNSLKAGKEVSTFSYVFPNMPKADETIWIDAFRNKNLDMHTFVGESYWPLKPPWSVSLNSPINNPYRLLKNVIYQQAQNKEIKVLFSGVFADHLYSGYIYWLVDQIKRKPFSAIKSLYSTTRQFGLFTSLKQASPAKWTNKIKSSTPWLNKASLDKFLEIQQLIINTSHPHPQQFNLVYGLSTAQNVWLDHEFGYKYDVFVRHPFRDRRIVELLMSIPAWVLGNNKTTKLFIRQASKGLLPDSVIRRKKITTLQPLFHLGVLDKELNKVKELLLAPSCQWQRYIKKDLIINMLNNPNNPYKEADYVILWQCICYEQWMKRIKKL